MEAHYPIALMCGWYFSRDNEISNATRHAVTEQMEVLLDAKAPLFENIPQGSEAPDAGTRILQSLGGAISAYRTGSAGGHNVIYAAMALKVHREFPGLFDEPVVQGICDLISACDSGEEESYTSDDLREFPGFIEAQKVADVIDNVLYDLNRDVGFHMHIMTHGQGLLELDRLGHGRVAVAAARAHLAHAISCQRWKTTVDLKDWSRVRPASHSPLTPEYWKEEAAVANWHGGHSFKYVYSFFEIKRAFPNHPMIAEGERSLQWAL
jgi:hypothetical protein